jgi:hypothetical protein
MATKRKRFSMRLGTNQGSNETKMTISASERDVAEVLYAAADTSGVYSDLARQDRCFGRDKKT